MASYMADKVPMPHTHALLLAKMCSPFLSVSPTMKGWLSATSEEETMHVKETLFSRNIFSVLVFKPSCRRLIFKISVILDNEVGPRSERVPELDSWQSQLLDFWSWSKCLILCASVPIPPKLVNPNSSSHAGNCELVVAFPCWLRKCWNIDHYIKGIRTFPIPVTEKMTPRTPRSIPLCKCLYSCTPS